MSKSKGTNLILLFLLIAAISFIAVNCSSSGGDSNQAGVAGAGGTLSVDAGEKHLNVGYGAPVTLTATVTGGGTTYLWSQTGGEPVDLSLVDLTQASITFNTLPLTVHKPNIVDEFAVLGISSEEAGHYTFEVEVTSGGQTATDTVEIRCTSPTMGLTNVPIGVPVYLNGTATGPYVWTVISTPADSLINTASIDGVNTQTPSFIPDVPGEYMLNEATQGNITILAGEWVGVGGIGGGSPNPPQCAACHDTPQWSATKGAFLPDVATPWALTGHASVMAVQIDNRASYNLGCVECHSLGFDAASTVENNGFNSVAESLGWEFPTAGVEGNWQGIIDNYPDLAEKSNIQCENCHGPGSNHYGDPSTISKSLRAEVCAVCHDEPTHHIKLNEWENSMHAIRLTYPEGNTSCVKCHEGNGFVAFSKWVDEGNDPDAFSGTVAAAGERVPQTCAMCHDPHAIYGNHYQLRLDGNAIMPDGTFNAGLAAECFTCHNSRRNLTDYNGDTLSDSADIIAAKGDNLEPHHTAQAEMFATRNFADINLLGIPYTFSKSYHATASFLAPGSTQQGFCVTCHMAEDPTGNGLVGGHTFAVYDEASGEENIESCRACHGPNLTTFNRKARADYDGDGVVEGIQSEIEGLIAEVETVLAESVCTTKGWTCVAPHIGTGSMGGIAGCGSRGIYFYDDDNPTNGVKDTAENDEATCVSDAAIPNSFFAAVYNLELVEEDYSEGVHNTAFAVQLLQSGWLAVTGNEYCDDHPAGTCTKR